MTVFLKTVKRVLPYVSSVESQQHLKMYARTAKGTNGTNCGRVCMVGSSIHVLLDFPRRA